jgi:uncharacterized repeat protein (TIGR01451 family)
MTRLAAPSDVLLRRRTWGYPLLLGITAAFLLSFLAAGSGVSSASAAGTAAWTVRSVAQPATFSPNDEAGCVELIVIAPKCDSYQLLVTNVGDAQSNGTITLTDTLPAGIGLHAIESGTISQGSENEFGEFESAQKWTCAPEAGPGQPNQSLTIVCEFSEPVPPGGYAPFLNLRLESPKTSAVGPLLNAVSITGGGTSSVASTSNETPISNNPAPFGVEHFDFGALTPDGTPSTAAGGHPWEVTAAVGVPEVISTKGENRYQPVNNVRALATELPAGLIGNPQAQPQCTQTQLAEELCPSASRVGAYAIRAGGISEGEWSFTGNAGVTALEGGCCSAVYNMVPENGYPAEFGLVYAHQTVFLYPTLIHNASGYRLRVIAPGFPSQLETSYPVVTFFGNPGNLNGSSEVGFLTNPSNCSAGALSSNVELESWELPGRQFTASTTAYAGLTGCSALQFHPSLTLQPDTTAADSPAGLNVDLQVPQTSGFEELATPPLKTAKVTLPEGLVVNPAAADGLEGCDATGPRGINIGSNSIGAKGQDLGDPEATELGAGHGGGNGSPYDDGYFHTAPGHCPAASTMGTVEATTPLLPEAIKGQIFLGSPECAPCSSADSEAGKLLKLYLEINDPQTGTILKLPGSVSANAATGRLTATFKENPQLPFSDLKLYFKTGPRAALTSPSTCGPYSTSSSLEPWSAPETPTAVSNSSFNLTSGPGGKPCAPPANAPHFEAGTTSTQAGAYAPFVLKLSREDGTQRLKALNVTLPAGLTGKLAGVQECSAAAITAAEGTGGKAEQASASCPLASELGTVNVGAGSGPNPFYVQGHAYLAGPYKGAPLSMAIITPAVAGPFDLGTVVVRAALFVDPYSAQITVKSDPIPQIRAGIPLDVRSIAVNISRNQFTLNPTSCDPMTLAATVVADASEAAVSNPFQVGGCSSLAFKPKLQISLKGGTKRNQHPALKAVVTYPQGGGYANIARAQVGLPHSEFLDQGNLDKVCKQAELLSATCPKSSIYGKAKAWTPLLDKPLEGPVYLAVGFGYKLPALVADLNGQIRILLKGKVDTDSQEGLRNTFETVPDAPVSRFVLEMKGGKKYGLLVNSENICAKTQKASARFVAANGKVLQLQPKIANSCGKSGKGGKGKSKHSKHASHRLGTSHR